MKAFRLFCFASIILSFFFGAFSFVFAAPERQPSFLFTPSAGTFPIDSTFDINIAIDTAGRDINAFKAKIYFPAERLQVVSSNTGKSITGFWIRRPAYSNERGEIEFEGAIPSPGINTSQGIIATLTFRVKSLGAAALRFDGQSAMYLNDGEGTQLNVSFQSGLYTLVLPPPLGPIVTSPTHPDQNKWYSVNDAVLQWNNDQPVEGYSYILNGSPVDVPDNISEGITTNAVYKALADGIHYFHVKALRNGVWGGVTHYGLKIQTGGPAGFTIDVNPSAHTSSKTIVFTFGTTDRLSGVNRYEAKIIRTDSPKQSEQALEPFFFEVQSPYIFKADDYGRYDFIVRAYNEAGNFSESVAKVAIVKPIFEMIAGEGVRIGELFTIPWYLFWLIIAIIFAIICYLVFHVYRWHLRVELMHLTHQDRNEVNAQKLGEMRDRFTSLNCIGLIMLLFGMLLFGTTPASAEVILPPPVTNIVSQNITNDEIFYIGGRAAAGSGSKVLIYVESLATGETFSFETAVSPTGEWLYTHPTFLQSGNYLLWSQLKLGEQASPPSSQIQLTVSPKAIQLGASRISFETLYLSLLVLFLIVSCALAWFGVHFWRKGTRRHSELLREVREAEDAIIRGFALLRKDIESELQMIQRVKTSEDISEQARTREQQLLRDLDEINKHIEKEVWDIERALGNL